MDLDNIKKKWQETEIKPNLETEKICAMLSNKGYSAFNSLLRYEKMGMIAMVACLGLGYLIFSRYPLIVIIYCTSATFGFFWQLYKWKKLKNTNIAEMTIMEVSTLFYWYRKVIYKEFFLGIVWFILFFIILGYLEITHDPSFRSLRITIFIAGAFIGLIGAIVTYKLMYWNNIKKLATAIKEVEEFEEENHK